MYYIVRLSGGTASAVAGERAIQRYDRDKVWLCFQDVKWEDEDNYRFLADCMKRWGGKLVVQCDGRTPLDVFEQKNIIPSSQLAPCSIELKIKPFEQWLWKVPKPVTILSGLGWHEPHRIDRLTHYNQHNGKWRAPQGFGRRISGVYEDHPLLWRPIETRTMQEVVRSWDIEPPRAYALGFPHSNCGGRCIRQGLSEWKRLKQVSPERFNEMRDWEQAQRAKGGRREISAINRLRRKDDTRPITLVELEQMWDAEQKPMDMFEFPDDMGSCFCTDT